MIAWRPHTDTPAGPETAVLAIKPAKDFPDDVDSILLADLYRWDVQHACWMGEANGLKLRHAEYWWLPERDLLATLP